MTVYLLGPADKYEGRHLEFHKAQFIDKDNSVIPVKGEAYEGVGSVSGQLMYTIELSLEFPPGLQKRYDDLEEVNINIRSKLVKDKRNAQRRIIGSEEEVDFGQQIVMSAPLSGSVATRLVTTIIMLGVLTIYL